MTLGVQGQTAEEVQEALGALRIPGARFRAVDVSSLPGAEACAEAAEGNGWPAAAFAKPALCELAGERSLWLDCDVVLLDDGALRLALEDQGEPLAAAPDLAARAFERAELAETGNKAYFNTGVLVWDRRRA